MRSWTMLLGFPAVLALSACHDEEWAANSSAPISDERLKELAKKPYDKAQMVGKRILLGTQNDVKFSLTFHAETYVPIIRHALYISMSRQVRHAPLRAGLMRTKAFRWLPATP